MQSVVARVVAASSSHGADGATNRRELDGKILGLLLPCLDLRSLFCAECVCRQWRGLVSNQLSRVALAIALSGRSDFRDAMCHLCDEIGSAWQSSCLLARCMRASNCDRGLLVSTSATDCTFSIANLGANERTRPPGPDGFSGELVRGAEA